MKNPHYYAALAFAQGRPFKQGNWKVAAAEMITLSHKGRIFARRSPQPKNEAIFEICAPEYSKAIALGLNATLHVMFSSLEITRTREGADFHDVYILYRFGQRIETLKLNEPRRVCCSWEME